jgi:hypothetical protein
MNLHQLKTMVDHAFESAVRGHRDPTQVTAYIRTYKTGTAGHVPVTGVKSVYMGFDWESMSCLITPETELREIDRDEVAELRKKYEELSWSKYKIDNIVRENKKLKALVEELKNDSK